jgi:hypothetical protein
MTSTVSAVLLRRSHDRSDHRKPLRMQITRRRTGKPAGSHEFVTQVRFAGAEAVVLPWDAGGADENRAPATDLAAA